MKTILTLLFLFSISFCFGQSQVKKDSKATQSVSPNLVQVEKLNKAYEDKARADLHVNDLVELIIGYKLDEVDSLRIDNGQFKFVLKPKKK